MIARIWHGYTTNANAAAYEDLVSSKIFRDIERKAGDGLKGVQLLKRDLGEEVEFTTIIWFQDLETVKLLTGDDYETAYVPDEAKKLLSRFDKKVTHSQLIYSSEDRLDKYFQLNK